MDLRHVRQRCEEKLRTLSLPRPFSLDEFCATLVRIRQRPLRLLPIPGNDDGPCGLWVSTQEADYVFHQVATSPLHQEHIILHELAHMVFDHAAVRESAAGIRSRLLPALDPMMVAAVLARSAYTTEQELEAETFADLVGGRAHRAVTTSDSDATFLRVRNVLGPTMS
ncbi:hypothetical protein [Jiangella muralis]|uniref:hypothetical protein n=1 Tax=Jiangella muralis TaxID=702383 RepID=UPI000B01D7C8|nr:hypothetical protein [Jiangella muralis]